MNTFIHQRQKTDNTDRDTNTKSNIVPTIQFALFEKNDPLRGNLLDFVPKRFIATPIYVLYANFVKFGRPEIGKVVRYLPHKKKQNFASLSRSRFCAGRAQNLPRPAAANVLRAPQISYKSVHFRRSYSRTREHRRNVP